MFLAEFQKNPQMFLAKFQKNPQMFPFYVGYESYVAIIKKMKSGGNCVKKGLKVLGMGI